MMGPRGRYSIAAFEPKEIRVFRGDEDPFQFLEEWLRDSPSIESDLPFAGGWIGYFGYELYSFLENKVPAREPDLLPKAVFCYYDKFHIYDHQKEKSPHPPFFKGGTPGTSPFEKGGMRGISSNFTKPAYLAAIQKIKNYIAAGDCYQVNLSQKFTASYEGSPYDLYQSLRQVSPAPYSAYLNLGEAQILSSSPECFLEVNGKSVVTRPIKGTRPRGKTVEEDEGLRVELETSAKDHAELVMITDLERNDLGRVCREGSVTVSNLGVVESYEQVHHRVATIQGELAEGKTVIDLLRATFPGGSITGAPKIRSMQIIHELEKDPRTIYTGAIGYLSRNGRAQFNIAIRTMVVKDRQTHFWAGGGIVADSDPEAEYQETLAKAKGMMTALGLDPSDLGDCLNDVGLEKSWEKESC